MSKYVSVTKLANGKTRIDLRPVAGCNSGYKIFLQNGVAQFFENVSLEEKTLTTTKLEHVKAGAIVYIKFSKVEGINPAYSVVLDNTEWTNNNIKDIEQQLVEQAESLERKIEMASYLQQVEDCVLRSKDYKSLIQQMIVNTSNKLSDSDIMDIQRTLTDIKEERGLSTRPSIKFGL